MITIRRRLVDRVAGTCYYDPLRAVAVGPGQVELVTQADRDRQVAGLDRRLLSSGTRSQCKRQAKDEEKQGSRRRETYRHGVNRSSGKNLYRNYP